VVLIDFGDSRLVGKTDQLSAVPWFDVTIDFRAVVTGFRRTFGDGRWHPEQVQLNPVLHGW
jgi:hypothetical protein